MSRFPARIGPPSRVRAPLGPLVIWLACSCVGIAVYPTTVQADPGDRGAPPLRIDRGRLLIALADAPEEPAASASADARSPAIAERIRTADRLLRNGRAREAYALLAEVEDEAMGETEFDYLLGAAAVDAGRPDRATLALERVLARDPGYAGAHIEMARAQLVLGSYADAARELDTAAAINPPEYSLDRIRKTRAEIVRRTTPSPWSWSGNLSVFGGRDSNVNFAASADQVLIPGFVTPVSVGKPKTADNFFGLGVGGEATYKVNRDWQLFGGYDGSVRENARQSEFDLATSQGHVGVQRNFGPNALRVGLTGGELLVDRNDSLHLLGASIEWRQAIGDRVRISPFLQYNELRYKDTEQGPGAHALSTDQVAYGIAGMRTFGGDGQHVLFGAAYALRESNVDGNPNGVRSALGLRAGVQVRLRESVRVDASVNHLASTFSDVNQTFKLIRGDHRTEAVVGLEWTFARDWSLTPQVTRTIQSVNIPVYAYDRTEALVTLRRDWH